MFLDLPRDKNYPEDSVQCDECGGCGCAECDGRGWFTPKTHSKGRLCSYEDCKEGPNKTRCPIPPGQVAVYCCNECAFADA